MRATYDMFPVGAEIELVSEPSEQVRRLLAAIAVLDYEVRKGIGHAEIAITENGKVGLFMPGAERTMFFGETVAEAIGKVLAIDTESKPQRRMWPQAVRA